MKQNREAGREPRGRPTSAEIVDRVLDRGIVIDSRERISVGGIDTLMAVDARYVVTSSETHLEYTTPLREPLRKLAAKPYFDGPAAPFRWATAEP